MNALLITILVCGVGDWFGLDAEQLSARLHKITDLARQQKIDEALKEANQAVVDYPGNSMLHLNRGWLNYQSDDKDAAMRDFERATQSDLPEVRFRALFNKARVLFAKGHQIVTESHLPETAVDLPPEQDVTPLVAATEEALKHLSAAEEGFVQTLLERSTDRDTKESLEAVNAEVKRLRQLLDELKQRQKEQQDKKNEQQNKDQKKDKEGKEDEQQPDTTQKENQDKQKNDQQSKSDQSKDSSQSQDQAQEQQDKDPQQSQKDKQQDQKPKQDPEKDNNNAKAEKAGEQSADPGQAKEQPLSPEQVQQLLQALQDLEQKKADLDKRRAMAIRGRQKVKKDW